MVFELISGLKVCPDQDQRPSENGIMCCIIRPGPKAQWDWDHTPYNFSYGSFHFDSSIFIFFLLM